MLRATWVGVALTLLTSCASAVPPAPLREAAAEGTLSRYSDNAGSWMRPDAASGDLLYVSDVRYVLVYSYPDGKLQGVLHGFYIARGECVDAQGDVYIVDLGFGKIFEYAHGGTKRITTLEGPTGDPIGCAIDPTTGNLAVTSLKFTKPAAIGIYKNARGKPTVHRNSAFLNYYYCGYDDKGNLFLDAENRSAAFAFAELPKGARRLEVVTLNQTIGFPGGVQWDGKHVAVGDQAAPKIYRFDVSGGVGKKVGTTTLGGDPKDVVDFFIDGTTLIAPDSRVGSNSGYVAFYTYPSGGKPLKKITKRVLAAQGAVVSKPP